jgi:RNA recognition motif-containing protein
MVRLPALNGYWPVPRLLSVMHFSAGAFMDITRIFIGNLDFSVTADDVKGLLSGCGTVKAVTMNRKKGFAFIEMDQADAAAQAVRQLDGTLHKGRTLRVSLEMKPRKARSVSIQRYKERGDALARQKADRRQPEKLFSDEKPTHPRRFSEEGGRPGFKRAPRPDAGFAPRKRPGGSDERPALKTGQTRQDRPARGKTFEGKPRDYAKPRTAGGSHGGFNRPGRPNARAASGPLSAARSEPRANGPGRGKPPRRA